jgi:hypothetical protein
MRAVIVGGRHLRWRSEAGDDAHGDRVDNRVLGRWLEELARLPPACGGAGLVKLALQLCCAGVNVAMDGTTKELTLVSLSFFQRIASGALPSPYATTVNLMIGPTVSWMRCTRARRAMSSRTRSRQARLRIRYCGDGDG